MRRPIQRALTQAPMELPDVPLLQGARSLFSLMEIAEQEIAAQATQLRATKRRYLEMGFSRECIEQLDQAIQRVTKQAFAILCPPELLRGKCPQVYRAHARELVRRVADTQDTTAPTDAEILCATLEMSYQAPLNQQYAALAEHLYPRVMDTESDGIPTPEPWTGATLEARVRLARSMVCRERVLRPLQ